MDRLFEIHALLKNSCSTDLSATAIYESLTARGERSGAQDFLNGYVEKGRRTRCALAIELRGYFAGATLVEDKKKEAL